MRHVSYANAVATIALFVALGGVSWAAVTLPAKSVGAKQLRTSAVTSRAIRNGSVASADLSAAVRKRIGATGVAGTRGAQGLQGPAGAKGDPGAPGARGLARSGSRQLFNVADLACGMQVVIGSLPLDVPEPSRLLTQAQGTINRDNAEIDEGGLWLQLRDAADTKTLATTAGHWAGRLTAGDVSPLAPGGLLMAGTSPDTLGQSFTAPPGSYLLQLVAQVNGTCSTPARADFGYNQGGSMSYVLVGTG